MRLDWVVEEYCSLDLGDARLDRVVKSFVSQSTGIGESTPDRCRKATGKPLSNASSIDQALDAATPRFTKEISVGARPSPEIKGKNKRVRNQPRSARDAVLTIRTIEATLCGPRRPGGGRLPNSTINVVELLEADPPADESPIRWVLYTTLPRYLNAFALLTVVAWRVAHLKTAARHQPNAPCSEYFSTAEWAAIVIFHTQKSHDETNLPTMNEFMKIIAMIGGYINKKSQGPPGSKTIWRGMSQYKTIVQAFATFNQLR